MLRPLDTTARKGRSPGSGRGSLEEIAADFRDAYRRWLDAARAGGDRDGKLAGRLMAACRRYADRTELPAK